METKTHIAKANWNFIAQFFRLASHIQSLILASLLTLLSFQLHAQSFTEVDIAAFDPIVISPNVYLNAGESAEFVILIGSSAKPISNSVGFKLNVELSADAKFQASVDPRLEGWLGSSSKLSETQVPNLPAQYKLAYEKSVPSSGFGQVLKIKVFSTANNVHASRLIKSVGGLMIIDNLDVRFGSFHADEAVEIKAFPNPCNGNFQLDGNVAQVASLHLYALNGQALRRFDLTQAFDISDFEAGCYLLEIRSKNGESSFQKIMKN